MKVDDLRKECRKNLLFPKGTKNQLVTRLQDNERDKGKMKINRFFTTKRTREQLEGDDEDQPQAAQIGMSPMKRPKHGPQNKQKKVVIVERRSIDEEVDTSDQRSSRSTEGCSRSTEGSDKYDDEYTSIRSRRRYDDDDDDDKPGVGVEQSWKIPEGDEGGGPGDPNELVTPNTVTTRNRREAQGGNGRVEGGEGIEDDRGGTTPRGHPEQALETRSSCQIWPKIFKGGVHENIWVKTSNFANLSVKGESTKNSSFWRQGRFHKIYKIR